MEAFIVRPFGTKQDVNFDKVEEELIQPALLQAGISGSTTAAIMEAGNIREDMFSKLLTADLVIADLSIHNANVFYELGVRHALRDKRTYLIRCSKDEIPFDLKTDRYLNYSAENPSATIPALVEGLRATIQSERQDSPVFFMLPKLVAQDPERFLAVPQEFAEEVEIARQSRQPGMLALLAAEAEGFPWEIPGLRMIGDVQYAIKDFEDAQMTWEKVRKRYPMDIEANDRLATIYQRLAEPEMMVNSNDGWELLAKSDLAVERLFNNSAKFDRRKWAEVFSLKARNAKARWVNSWKNCKQDDKLHEALESSYLTESFKHYERGYSEDLNHFYSGINALGLLTVIISLAESLPATWDVQFDSTDEAAYSLKKYKDQHEKLAIMVRASIEAEKKRLEKKSEKDPWLIMTEADLSCLTSTRPERVATLYEKALQESSDQNFEAAKRQLLLYQQLKVKPENVKAALAEFTETEETRDVTKKHYILFTGHMLDKKDREEPRFPAEMEKTASAAIKEAVEKEISKIEGPVLGIAGGACGGDILFHEVCAELNITTEMYLALPREQFLAESVQFAGTEWVERFNRLYKKLKHKILAETKQLPTWLNKKVDYSIWERNNLWMLNSALVCGGLQMTLIALWDGKKGDGAGGTEHMVQQVLERGGKTIVLDTKELFGVKANATL